MSRQPIMLTAVLLPEPLGPMMETNSPFLMSRFTPLRAFTSTSPILYVFQTSSSRIIESLLMSMTLAPEIASFCIHFIAAKLHLCSACLSFPLSPCLDYANRYAELVYIIMPLVLEIYGTAASVLWWGIYCIYSIFN